MKLHLLACDYDGTSASDGVLTVRTAAALERLIASGRKLVMVTGRELDDLFTTFRRPELFDWIVAENGAVIYHPATRKRQALAEPPPAHFVAELKARGVGPISTGDVIVATWHPHEDVVLETIRDLSLELQVIFNKGAVMILPGGVTKASGLRHVLKELGFSPHNTIAVGDAENDHSLLKICECGVAVDNALPALKEIADWVSTRPSGDGVAELVDYLIQDEDGLLRRTIVRHEFPIGMDALGRKVMFNPHEGNVLIAGSSGAGKSTVATSIIEALAESEYQFCIVDPEGDYLEFERATVVGNSQRPPAADEPAALLEKSFESAVYNLVGVPLLDRPAEFLKFFSRVQDLRSRSGRPHWLLIDEAHHVLPAESSQAAVVLPQKISRCIFVTLNPQSVLSSAMQPVEIVIGVGPSAPAALKSWAKIAGIAPPRIPDHDLEKGEVLFWRCKDLADPFKMKILPSLSVRKRHRRKYAEGELPEDRSFYFRGPQQKLNLRAHNLITFLQMGEGVDADTWFFHLRRGDYSQWVREAIKDQKLADELAQVEQNGPAVLPDSFLAVKKLVETEYTLPTKSLATEKNAGDLVETAP